MSGFGVAACGGHFEHGEAGQWVISNPLTFWIKEWKWTSDKMFMRFTYNIFMIYPYAYIIHKCDVPFLQVLALWWAKIQISELACRVSLNFYFQKTEFTQFGASEQLQTSKMWGPWQNKYRIQNLSFIQILNMSSFHVTWRRCFKMASFGEFTASKSFFISHFLDWARAWV